MDPRLTLEASVVRAADMRRRADAARSAASAGHRSRPRRALRRPAAVTVRFASAEDDRALSRLSQLDSGSAPARPALVAEVDGELVAALPIGGGRPVADPFRPTTELVRLLELRAAQLRGDGDAPRRRLGPRLLRPWRPTRATARP